MVNPTIMSLGARIAFFIFTLGIVLNFAETAFFGWHWNAGVTSHAENTWDLVCSVMIVVGMIALIYYRNWGGG